MINKFRNWALQATGRSYWHLPLPMSVGFRAEDLSLYFIDNTEKTNWKGAIDGNGIPLLAVDEGLIAFPTTVFQKTLGHWNLMNGQVTCGEIKGSIYEYHRSQFLVGANWAEQKLETGGGWKLPIGPSAYSAMTQGQGVSVLVRAHHLTGEIRYLEAALSAFRLFGVDENSGGVVGRVHGRPFLQEFPGSTNVAVLNGAIFALFGIYDLYIKTANLSHFETFKTHLASISCALPCYDIGYWSRYDLSGNIASPFYHNLHIAQLRALAVVDESGPFDRMEKKFSKYGRNPIFLGLAIGLKIRQKFFLKDPEHGPQRA